MIGKVFKTVIWWGVLIAAAFFFLSANAIDSPKALWEWAEDAGADVRAFFDSTTGEVDVTKIPIEGEEIDTPQETE